VRRPGWGLALFLLISVLPILASLVYVALYSVGLAGILARGFTLEHWSAVLAASELWSSLGVSLWIASAVVIVSTVLGLTIALGLGPALDHGPVGWSLHVPLAFPAVLAALSVFMLFGATGWIPRVLLQLGLISSLEGGWSLVQDPWGLGVVVAHAFAATALLALSFRALQHSENLAALDRVAAALGASPRQRLWHVALPLLLRRGAPTLALVFILVLGSYEIPLLLGRPAPQMLTVLVMHKYTRRFDLAQKPEALVVAVIYTALVTAVIAWLAWRRARQAEPQS
jgi:putative spermidine/putrescine transport system permease protein